MFILFIVMIFNKRNNKLNYIYKRLLLSLIAKRHISFLTGGQRQTFFISNNKYIKNTKNIQMANTGTQKNVVKHQDYEILSEIFAKALNDTSGDHFIAKNCKKI